MVNGTIAALYVAIAARRVTTCASIVVCDDEAVAFALLFSVISIASDPIM